jgi:transcription initiation factor TFIIIB Brf1 subunit/transcription initiation factor TFIIB
MICEACGSSNLIWDSRGEVVCGDCGVVNDRIYLTENFQTSQESDQVTLRIGDPLDGRRMARMKRYEGYLKKFDRKRFIIVKSSLFNYLKGSKRVKTMLRRDSRQALELLRKDPDATKIYEKVIAHDLFFNGRTEKTKVAMAFYLKYSLYRREKELTQLLVGIGIQPSYFKQMISKLSFSRRCELLEESHKILNR